jgi:molybdenum cofactor biosynthesis enzyme
MDFSHYSKDGSPTMVDVADKKITSRMARARGFISMEQATIELIDKQLLPRVIFLKSQKLQASRAQAHHDLIPCVISPASLY